MLNPSRILAALANRETALMRRLAALSSGYSASTTTPAEAGDRRTDDRRNPEQPVLRHDFARCTTCRGRDVCVGKAAGHSQQSRVRQQGMMRAQLAIGGMISAGNLVT